MQRAHRRGVVVTRCSERRRGVLGDTAVRAGARPRGSGACPLLLLVALCAASCWAAPQAARDEDESVRPPAVAGRFYPADAATLRRAVETLVRQARPVRTGDAVAVVAPHAGYVYSGQIAADALVYAAAARPEVVVVLGANHTGPPVHGFALHPGRAFRTPLGEVVIDAALNAALRGAGVGAAADAAPHRDEHSIEVQLPFLQVIAPGAPILPVIVGTRDPDQAARFGRALAAALGTRRAMIVASSDLSHYPTARDATRVDMRTLDAFARFDRDGALEAEREAAAGHTPNLVTAACGLGPVLVAMSAARALGATHGTVVSYANSADTAIGEAERVVGYGAVVYSRGAATPSTPPASPPHATREGSTRDAPTPMPPTNPSGHLPDAERQALLHLARATIAQFLESQTLPLARDVPPALATRRQGAFVTLKAHGQLRGCIGRIVEEGPLPQLVSRVAFEAAFRDQRFSPVTRQELDRIELEVSVLTAPRRVPSAEAIVTGRDGVVLRRSGRSAVFLPQVATEQGWTREQLLDALCEKAGLARGCWLGAELSTFQAEVFGERQAH